MVPLTQRFGGKSEKMRDLISICIKSKKSLNVAFFFILFTGYWNFQTSRRESFPSIDLGTVMISCIYPGATAEAVEKLITSKIEKELISISGLRKITSISAPERSYIVFQVEDSYIKEKNRIVFDIQKAVDKVSLPDGLHQRPTVINGKVGVIPVLTMMLYHESDEIKHTVLEQLELEIRKIHGVGDVGKIGYREKEILIEINPQKLIQKDITLLEVVEAIRKSSTTFPGGKIRINDAETSIRIYNNFLQLNDVKTTIIVSNFYGNSVTIGDVATVSLGYSDADVSRRVRNAGNSALALQVLKSEDGDIIKICEKVQKIIQKYSNDPELSKGCKIFVTDDLSSVVRKRLRVLGNNAWWGVVLVFLCLFLFLETRITFWASMGLPFAFCLAYLLSNIWFGVTINLMSMFGFIVVVGMLVDDSIVVAENIQSHKLQGKSSTQSAIDGTSEVFLPVLACVFTTIAAFLPMLVFEGIVGRMMREIPIVVTMAMLSSLLECLFILPAHLSHDDFESNPSKSKYVPTFISSWIRIGSNFMTSLRVTIMSFLLQIHSRSLQKVLRRPLFFVSAAFVVCFTIMGFSVWKIPWNPFPGGVVEYKVLCEFPSKTTKKNVESSLDMVESRLRETLSQKDVSEYISYVGYWDLDGGNFEYAPYLGYVEINLKPPQERSNSSDDIEKKIRSVVEDLNNSKTLKFLYKITKDSGGPPVGHEIEVELSASTYEELASPSQDLEDFIKTLPNTTGIHNGLHRKSSQLSVKFDKKRSSQLGINLEHASATIARAFGSIKITEETELLKTAVGIVVRLPEKDKNSIETLQNLCVRNQQGALVPLKQFIKIELEEIPSNFQRSRGYLVNYIGAEVHNRKDRTQNASYLKGLIKKELPKLQKKYPKVMMALSGEFEESSRLGSSIAKSTIITGFAIFFILTTLFQSTALPLIIMLAIPFGLAGMSLGVGIHYILSFFIHIEPHLYSFSLIMMVGAAALFGIVVNDSCVLVTVIESLRKSGVPLQHAVFKGALSRMRAVVLTTVTTLVGMIPFSYGIIGGGEPFLQPMGIAVIWGVTFATIVTLLIIPCAYVLLRIYFFGDKYVQENLQEIADQMKIS